MATHNAITSRGIGAVGVRAAAEKAAGDAVVTCMVRMANGGFQKISAACSGMRGRDFDSHLTIHGQPHEIHALEAKHRRFEQLFFLAAYFFFPAELTVTGITLRGAARNRFRTFPGVPRDVAAGSNVVLLVPDTMGTFAPRRAIIEELG